jgi:hypothetical protein
MWKESTATEPLKATGPAATARPIAEDEYQAIVDRLDATREVLCRREAETRTLQSRNAELGNLCSGVEFNGHEGCAADFISLSVKTFFKVVFAG